MKIGGDRSMDDVINGGKAKLVHHPISFGAFPCTSSVVNQSFLEANALIVFPIISSMRMHRLVDAGRFPESRPRHPIRSNAVLVLSPSFAKEIPLFISCGTRRFCMASITNTKKKKKTIVRNIREDRTLLINSRGMSQS